jgi:hydrogenase-4 transcriptional activator
VERFEGLLLDVWREACRNIEIDESVPTLARVLTRRVPLTGLQVEIFDWERRLINPRARGVAGGSDSGFPGPRHIRPDQAASVRAWADGRSTAIRPARSAGDPWLSALFDGAAGTDSWIAAPLASDHGTAGVLLLRIPGTAALDDERLRVVEHLIEPFSVALENDRRLFELQALREASEAERRSALARLGRADLVETIIGMDSGLGAVMRRVSLVAASDVPVLILGETGSGKEVIARAIHEKSPRANAPFIRVNCGAIPSELVDSELFGHERGAFTGATASRRGWFERADKGTLLLDEIGELPLPAQIRLLRVLQEGLFERVGGERSIRVDVRIVAATHRDLPTMVREGRFREDLWYRITGFPVLLPPLRDRKEDIPALARHFADRAARRFGLRPLTLSPGDLDMLMSYSWPGNIRELASVIDRAAILGAGESLEIAKSLGGNLLAHDGPKVTAVHRSSHTPTADFRTLDDVARAHIEAALRVTGGRIEGKDGIARLLGVNPHTLRARMRKLGIDWSRFRPGHAAAEPAGHDAMELASLEPPGAL